MSSFATAFRLVIFLFVLGAFTNSTTADETQDLSADSIVVGAGNQSVGTVDALEVSDNSDLSIRRSTTSVQPIVEFEISTTSPFEGLSAFEFEFECSVFARTEITQTISLFNFETGLYEQLDSRPASRFVDATVSVQPSGNSTRFVEPGTLNMIAKIKFDSPVARTRFTVNADYAVWRVTAEPQQIVPLYDSSTLLEPETTIETSEALITRIGDRVRDRHAREGQFQAYDHYLSFYWEQRTVELEIVDRVAKGGSTITVNAKTLTPLGTRDFRAFFRGLNTVAEYHHNVGMTQVAPNEYTTTITWNNKEVRDIQVGDRMEFEFSPFLAAPDNGRTNYYGTAMLYIVGEGIVPWQGEGAILDSFPIPAAGLLGGQTTLHYQYSNEPDNLFKQMAGNMAPINAQPFVLGRRLHHTDFGSGAHSEQPNPNYSQQAGKLGPNYIAESCVACHVNNGRALAPAINASMFRSVVRVGNDSVGTPHPTLGSVLQPRSLSGSPETAAKISAFETTSGTYGDGLQYTLQKPEYAFQGTTVPNFYSVRLAPPLVGMGLLEAIDEATIIALADPNDVNGDGISGRIQTVVDPETGELRLGRFNDKAGQARLKHQVAAALNTDMGVTTEIFPDVDGETGSGQPELADYDLDDLTRYVALLGVGARRNLGDSEALLGEQLFTSIGCAACHIPSLTTGSNHPMTELRSQTIHPFTDLLLHDMGPGLADNMGEGNASGAEWRTPPLWNIGQTADVSGGESYLHDGRARNLDEAILWHGGEGESSKEAFRLMSASERAAIVKFLKSL